SIVRTVDPVFDGVGGSTMKGLFPCLQDASQVVGVEAGSPQVDRGFAGRHRLVTEHAEMGSRPEYLAGLQVHVNRAHPRSFHGETKPLLALLQSPTDLLTLGGFSTQAAQSIVELYRPLDKLDDRDGDQPNGREAHPPVQSVPRRWIVAARRRPEPADD